MSLSDVPERDYRLWVDGKIVPTGPIPAFRVNVIDLAARPAMWGDRGIHYVHFHLRRSTMDDAAASLGFEGVGGFRPSIGEEDIVLAQMVKSILPYVALNAGPPPLALDHLELILAAHVMQRYGASRQTRAAARGGLSAWQRRQVTEMMRENLDGRIRLAELARACDLSVSHFARSFRTSFGITCHHWVAERRIERAKDLLSRTAIPLADIASLSGFADQASFTRAFRRIAEATPGQWRREHASGPLLRPTQK